MLHNACLPHRKIHPVAFVELVIITITPDGIAGTGDPEAYAARRGIAAVYDTGLYPESTGLVHGCNRARQNQIRPAGFLRHYCQSLGTLLARTDSGDVVNARRDIETVAIAIIVSLGTWDLAGNGGINSAPLNGLSSERSKFLVSPSPT